MSIEKTSNQIILTNKNTKIFLIIAGLFSILVGIFLLVKLSTTELFFQFLLIGTSLIILGVICLISAEKKLIVLNKSDKSITFSSQKIFTKFSKTYQMKEVKEVLLIKSFYKDFSEYGPYFVCEYKLIFILRNQEKLPLEVNYFHLGFIILNKTSFVNTNKEKLINCKELVDSIGVPLIISETFGDQAGVELTNKDKLHISMFLNKNNI
ncbi:MAG: hypothetical protein AABX38_06395 [Candidatus Micrarchaeota archaeon]